ncbi:SDR family NAD(P)-dependent oxidoreductase [Halorussus marinus]|uniref:SDR family NAD(P)-dependent oxidoreductase n=1 Tax=Halorussus marinus TaxID=2505976 RepID=UPI001FCF25FF|nr:SDR family oxidoreductase [Halorussus marinus]
MSDTDRPRRFEGETVLVTGSTRGIGAGVAERFAREGANVVVTGRSEDDGAATVADVEAAGGEATFVRADMRDPDDIAALVEATAAEYGGLDVLVNNAGVETDTGAAEASIDDWELVLETDFRAYWLCAKRAREQMDEGAIVNVSSNHAFLTMPEMFPYNAVKAGINGMTRAMALDFGPAVRVNTVNPGWVAVDRTTEQMDASYREHLESIHPVGRLGRPADVAGAVAFLASDDAAFLTGESLLVDGGRTAVMQDDALPDYRERRATNGDETESEKRR